MSLTEFLNTIEDRVNSAGTVLKNRNNWFFTDIHIRDIYPKVNRTLFRKAFAIIAKRVASKGFHLANEVGKTPQIDFSAVRLYYRRPTEMVPKGCSCPDNLSGERRQLPYVASQQIVSPAKPNTTTVVQTVESKPTTPVVAQNVESKPNTTCVAKPISTAQLRGAWAKGKLGATTKVVDQPTNFKVLTTLVKVEVVDDSDAESVCMYPSTHSKKSAVAAKAPRVEVSADSDKKIAPLAVPQPGDWDYDTT